MESVSKTKLFEQLDSNQPRITLRYSGELHNQIIKMNNRSRTNGAIAGELHNQIIKMNDRSRTDGAIAEAKTKKANEKSREIPNTKFPPVPLRILSIAFILENKPINGGGKTMIPKKDMQTVDSNSQTTLETSINNQESENENFPRNFCRVVQFRKKS